jgi:hypothetical protein
MRCSSVNGLRCWQAEWREGNIVIPAMAAGISDHVWSVEEIIDLDKLAN